MLGRLLGKFIPSADDRRRRQLLFDRLRPGDIFIDCGANVGQETILALKLAAVVYAFEPNPNAYAVLRQRVGKNKNAHLFPYAVGAKAGRAVLYFHQNHDQDAVAWSTGSSLIKSKKNIDPNRSVSVKVVDLAKFIIGLNRPIRAVKIDVEGVEFPIIRSLVTSGAYRKVDYTLVETHADKMPELRKEEASVKELLRRKKISTISLDWV